MPNCLSGPWTSWRSWSWSKGGFRPAGRGEGSSAAPAAGFFLDGQKETKEPLRGRGVSIVPTPENPLSLKRPIRGAPAPLLDVPPGDEGRGTRGHFLECKPCRRKVQKPGKGTRKERHRCTRSPITLFLPTRFRQPDHEPANTTRTARRNFNQGTIGPFHLGRAAAGGEGNGILSLTRAGYNRPAISSASPVMGDRGKVNWRPSEAQADRERPPAIFWSLLHRCKSDPPAGGIPRATAFHSYSGVGFRIVGQSKQVVNTGVMEYCQLD